MTELEMFAKLPQLSEDCKETKFSYIPTLSLINNITTVPLKWTNRSLN